MTRKEMLAKCRLCKHHKVVHKGFWNMLLCWDINRDYPECHHPKSHSGVTDNKKMFCSVMRDGDVGKCGEEAKLFEPK